MILGFEIIGLFSMRILLGWFSAIFGCAETKVEESQLAEQYVAGQKQMVGIATSPGNLAEFPVPFIGRVTRPKVIDLRRRLLLWQHWTPADLSQLTVWNRSGEWDRKPVTLVSITLDVRLTRWSDSSKLLH